MKRWWVPGLQIGYEHSFVHQVADFLEGLSRGERASPTFREAMATDLVTEVLRSAKSGRWEEVEPNDQGEAGDPGLIKIQTAIKLIRECEEAPAAVAIQGWRPFPPPRGQVGG